MSTRCARSRAALGFPGIWFLNGSYQWSCTALAREEAGTPWLARTLDWPFPGLGRFVEIARMRGPAGEFYNVTWPGYVGALTALAPGRFAAAINQAPLRRRTLDPRLRLSTWRANALQTLHRARDIPPDQLLRQTLRDRRRLCAGAAHAGDDAGGAAGDLHARRLPAGRALRDRAHAAGWPDARTTITAPPTTGCKARRTGRAASAPTRC